MSRKALGRGLKALIPDTKPSEDSSLRELDVEQVTPGRLQPRLDFDAGRIEELARSISRRGIIQPIVVKPLEGGRYELIAGERRWRAAREAGLKKIPALIRKAGDAETLELALVENLQRENLNPMEAARAYQLLIDRFGLTQEEVASQVGKDRSSVANHLRLLRLPQELQEELTRGTLSMGHARALLSLGSREKQIQAARRIISRALSVREAERLVKQRLGETTKKRAPKKDIYIKDLEDKLRRALGTKVAVHLRGGGGTIEMSFFSGEDLERLVEHLTAKS